LDVGCGTGAATRAAAQKIGGSGAAIGVDVNSGMLDVARSLDPLPGAAVEWRQGTIYDLPVAAEQMDVVLCAQVLQFLTERTAAVAEMRRVLKPGGRLALSLWADIRESPYFHALVEAMARYVGPATAAGLKSAFNFTDAQAIRTLLDEASFANTEIIAEQIELDLPLPEQFVPVHVGATPMAAGFQSAPADAQRAVVNAVSDALADYRTHDGVCVPFTTYLIMAVK
jgi:ubiquinone/menaquinone biosynthesis C-methylase UbiE